MNAREIARPKKQPSADQPVHGSGSNTWHQLVATIALNIRQSLNLTEILQTTVDQVQPLLGCDRALIYQFSPDWSGEVVAEAISAPQWSVLHRVIHDPCFEANWLTPYQEGRIFALDDVAAADLTPCHAEFLASFHVQANLVVPLLGDDQLWGLLVAHHCTSPRSWSAYEKESLQQLAVHVGIAIHQASLVNQLNQAKTALEAQVAERTHELTTTNQRMKQLAIIVESSQDAIIGKTPEGIITSWNKAAETIFGYTAEEMIGQSITAIIPPQYREEAASILDRVRRGEQVNTYETQRLRKNGQFVDVALTISPIVGPTGELVGVSKIARDITERKRSEANRLRNEKLRLQIEQALGDSRLRFKSFMDNAPLLSWSINRGGYVEYANEAWFKFLGHPEEAAMGQSINDLFPPEFAQDFRHNNRQVLQTGQVLETCEQAPTADGEIRHFLVRKFPIYQEGLITAVGGIAVDITEQKQTEVVLRDQAETLRIFYDTSPLMMGLVEISDNDILHVSDNPASLKFFGKTAAELSNQWASEIGIPPDILQRWLAHYRQSQQERRPAQFDYEHITPSGRFWLLVTVTFVGTGASGRPQFSYIVQDRTEKKRLEGEKAQAVGRLQDSEQRYASLVAALPVGIFHTDARGHCIYVNERWIQLSGLSFEQSQGDGWVQAIHPDDRNTVVDTWMRATQEQRPLEMEFRLQSTTGEVLWVYAQAVVEQTTTGQPMGYVGTVTDITDRKQIEAERLKAEKARMELTLLEQILDVVLAGYWDWHIPSDTEYLSPGFKRMFGYADHELANSPTTWQTLIFPEDLPAALAQFDRHIQSRGTEPYYNEGRYRHKNGSTVWVICSGQVIEWDEGGNPVRMIGCHIDITERKRTEADLRQSEATNRALIQAIPDFLMRMGQDGTYLEVINEGAVNFLHPSAQSDILGLSVADVMPAPIGQERLRLAQLALATDKMQRQEYEFEDQGQPYFEEARITPLGDNEVLVMVRDITEHKRATRELKATKDQLELFIQATSEGFWDWDLITNTIDFSPRWKEMLGYADHELDNTLEMWGSLIFEEDHKAALQLVEDYNSGSAERFSMVQRFHHKNGSTVYVLSRAIHLKDDQGNVIRMVGSHLDITSTIHVQEALRNSEMQLSGILNSSLDGIMAFKAIRNEQGRIIDFEWLLSNPTACDLVGKAPDRLIGKRLLEEMPGNREDGLFDLYTQVVETGEPIQRQFHYSHEGLDSWFETIAVKLGDGFAVTFRNISAIKESEQALQQANQNLELHLHDLQQRNQEMLLLSETSDFLQACRTIEEACAVISTLVRPLFPDCSGAFFITNSSRNRVEQVAVWGDHVHSAIDFPPHDCWALRRGRWHQIGQNRLGLRCNHVSASAADLHTLCIPMIAQGETLGLFYLNAAHADILSTAKRQLARTVAEQVGLAIANLYLRETLQNQSIRDPLTGLFNRRYLEEALQQEIARALRNQYPIGVVMVDVDHFKRFNDTYGHDAGDFVLKTIGQVLKENVRGSDIACRYGGEEMTLVFPETTLQAATARAEQLRQVIGQLQVTYNGQPLGALTASFGIAVFPDHGVVGTALVQAADAALYRAKAAGRNRVMAVDLRPGANQP